VILPPLVFPGVPINLFQTRGDKTSHPFIVVSNPMQEILECEIKNYLIFGESQTSRFGQKIRLELRQNFFFICPQSSLSKAAADCTYKEQGAVMGLF
jgi:hypothetical protein